MIEKLMQLITEIDSKKSDDFAGIGLIVYKKLENLPVTPLIKLNDTIKLPIMVYSEIFDFLVDISNIKSPYHDGFHLLSRDFKLTHISQYFSTPIIEEANFDYKFGSRVRTAVYGSFLEDVEACAVISNNHKPMIFSIGKRIF